jgi:UDP-2,3-diacylglucosamine pyrophosphatase LpxH
MEPSRYRTIWLSDTHLGTRGCWAEDLLAFPARHECDFLYLVGDIIDLRQLRRAPRWPPLHSNVIGQLLIKARHGTVVTFIPGNHDEYLRRFCDLQLGNVMVTRETVHRTADGRLLLIVHGDEFHSITQYHRWVAHTGDIGYAALLDVNRWFNKVRRACGLPYWSLSAYVKSKVKSVVSLVTAFEVSLAREARRRQLHGVVCGHIHRAEIRSVDGILYCYTGDWVESCTALVEHSDGAVELVSPVRAAVLEPRVNVQGVLV